MRQLKILGLLLWTFCSMAQTLDTLQTANVTGQLLRAYDQRTAADSMSLLVHSAADYLVKDARYQLRQYAPGSVITSNFGGANASQSAIIWDGIDISSSASGVVDLSLVPAVLLRSDAVLEGSSAGASGINSIAGALNLGLAASGKREFMTLLNTDNIGGLGIGVISGGHFGKVNYRSYLYSEQSENNYPYTFGGQRYIMEGMSYNQLTFLQRYQGSYRRSQWSTNVWYTSSEKRNRGSILSAPIPSLLEDESLRINYSWQKRKQRLTVFASREWQAYTDTLGAINLRDTNTYDQFTTQYKRVDQHVATIVDVNYYRAGGTSRDAQLPAITFRQNIKWSPRWSSLVRLGWFRESIYPAAQVIWNNRSEKIPVQWTAGSFYRLPTLNELFWSPGGNPLLQPERSLGTKLTATKSVKRWELTLASDQLFVQGLIQWMPQNGSIWAPQNVNRVFLSTQMAQLHYAKNGFESTSSINQQFTRILGVNAGTGANVGKALVYRPNLQGVQTFSYRKGLNALQWRSHYLGSRHTLRDNDPTGRLAAEFWTDISLVREFVDGQLIASATVHNVFDANRTYFPYFPMPGRYFSIQLKLSSKK